MSKVQAQKHSMNADNFEWTQMMLNYCANHTWNNIILSSNNGTSLRIAHIFLNIWQLLFELGYEPKTPLQSQKFALRVKRQPPTFETFMSEPAICWPPTRAH